MRVRQVASQRSVQRAELLCRAVRSVLGHDPRVNSNSAYTFNPGLGQVSVTGICRSKAGSRRFASARATGHRCREFTASEASAQITSTGERTGAHSACVRAAVRGRLESALRPRRTQKPDARERQARSGDVSREWARSRLSGTQMRGACTLKLRVNTRGPDESGIKID